MYDDDFVCVAFTTLIVALHSLHCLRCICEQCCVHCGILEIGLYAVTMAAYTKIQWGLLMIRYLVIAVMLIIIRSFIWCIHNQRHQQLYSVYDCTALVVMMQKLMSRCVIDCLSQESPAVSSLLFSKDRIQPPLVSSLFPNVPPTLNFVVSGQKGLNLNCVYAGFVYLVPVLLILFRLHEVQPIVTDVRSVCLSVCLPFSLSAHQSVCHKCTKWCHTVKPTWDLASLCRVIWCSLCLITLASCYVSACLQEKVVYNMQSACAVYDFLSA